MLAYKYHVPTSGVLVRRGDETVVMRDGVHSLSPPAGFGFERGFQHDIKLTDDWVGKDWGDREHILWNWFKEHGDEISREEAGRTPTPLHAEREEVHE